MTEHAPAPAGRFKAPEAARRPSGPASRHPGAGQPGARQPGAGQPDEISIERVSALVERASGAYTAAIEGLEAIVADLRRAREARDELAATVPPELLRQVLIARASSWHTDQPGQDGPPVRDEASVRPERWS